MQIWLVSPSFKITSVGLRWLQGKGDTSLDLLNLYQTTFLSSFILSLTIPCFATSAPGILITHSSPNLPNYLDIYMIPGAASACMGASDFSMFLSW